MASRYYSLIAPRTLSLVPSVETPRSGDTAIRTLYSAISPGTELAAYNGLPPLRETASPYPRLMGYCNVGVVESVPEGQSELAPGDVVLTHASHRSHFSLPPSQVLAKVPRGADLAAASVTYLFHLGYAAVLKAAVRPGHKVALVGLGALGLTAAAMVDRSGAAATGFSAHVPFDAHARAFGLRDVRGKGGAYGPEFDVVISTSNDWEDWRLALEIVRRGGTIVCLGFPGRGRGLPDFNPLDSRWFYDKQLTIMSCGHTASADVEQIDIRFTLKRNCQYLLDEILAGRLPARELIAEIRPASELGAVYEELSVDRRQGRTVVLDWTAAN